ncbi:hypothetical protein B0H17DRAFT_936306 [Mycena rosella]|uniref:NAD(P)-binding protein n=1 Tax=Mycena rosella TaxID=1033263 RepID=A0AAD7DF31_MYCRO|nr:hypothetical protein B0H17DRAFT_936306 [Mycena rosella]
MSLVFSNTTTAEEVATAFADEIKGKNVLITGTSLNGIGFETARAIAKHANLVVITGHNAERLKLTEHAIKQEMPSANIRPLMLDLSSLAAVRKAAAEVNQYREPLHVLIHNAAAPATDFKLTVDKLESQMATDHIGPFLLTKLITAKILAAGTAHYTPRVVFISSIGHGSGAGVNFSTLGAPDAEHFDPIDAYYQAKSANVLTAIELSKRSKGLINAYSLHPGSKLHTPSNLSVSNESNHTFSYLYQYNAVRGPGYGSLEAMGFKTSADYSRRSDKPGSYLDDCKVANESIAPPSSDPANAEKLWTLTEKIVGETFEF